MNIEQLENKYLIKSNINKFNTFMFFNENEICFHSNKSTNLESRINKSMKFDEIIKSFNENNISYNIIKYEYNNNDRFYITINIVNFYNFYCKCKIMFNYNNNFIDYINFSPEFGFYQNLGNNPAEACCKLYFLNKEILLDKINKNQLKYLSFDENENGGCEMFNLNINNDFNLKLTNFRECFNERIEFKYGN